LKRFRLSNLAASPLQRCRKFLETSLMALVVAEVVAVVVAAAV
jgi:hypothetical protein